MTAATMLLAGCTSKAGPAAVGGPTLPSHAQADFDEVTGAIRGFVLTDEQVPLPGIDVLLLPAGAKTTSAADGSYAFSYLEPGRYTLHAAPLLYEDVIEQVEVRAGETTPKDLLLVAKPVLHPRKQVLSYTGFMECRWASFGSGMCGSTGVCLSTCITTADVVAPLWTRDKNEFFFKLGAEDWEEIVFEVKWQPSTAATNAKMNLLFSYQGRPGNHEFGSSKNFQSPIWWNFTKGKAGENQRLPANTPKVPDTNLTLRAWLAVGASVLDFPEEDAAGIAYETRYDMAVTIFYSQRAPEKYSAFTVQ